MKNKNTQFSGYVLAASLGEVGGGLLVAAVTRAIPKMMTQFMTRMMAEMREGECDPAEF